MSVAIKHVVAVLLLLAIFGGVCLSSLFLPPIREMAQWGVEEGNLVGQGGSVWAMYSLGLLLTLYAAKRQIVARNESSVWASYLFFLAFLASLPFLWFLCEPDWFHPHIYRWMCWYGDPLAFWVVPTGSFIVDLQTKPLLRAFLLRSVVEIIIIFPIWMICWVFLSFFLGGGWI